MQTRTATVHLPDVGGHPGIARTFKLSHPLPDGHEYVTIWVQPSYGIHVGPEVVIIPAGESGACAEPTLKRRPGSFVLHDEPITVAPDGTITPVEHVLQGAWWLALKMLGYDLAVEDTVS